MWGKVSTTFYVGDGTASPLFTENGCIRGSTGSL